MSKIKVFKVTKSQSSSSETAVDALIEGSAEIIILKTKTITSISKRDSPVEKVRLHFTYKYSL